MLDYQIARLKSRRKSQFDVIFCEMPQCRNIATEIHHITRSLRWKRTCKKDGSDVIALCRECHAKIHAKNTSENIKNLLEIVNKILIKKMYLNFNKL